MLKRPLLTILVVASGLLPGTGFAQGQFNTFTPQVDNFSCAPPYGSANDTPPMSRQDTVEQVVRAGQTATLCLTRDSTIVLEALRCRRTEGAGEEAPATGGGGTRRPSAPGPESTDVAPQSQSGGAASGGAGIRGGQEMTRSWTCPTGRPCFGDGGFLGGLRQTTMNPGQARFCVRYLNAGESSHTVRADFVFAYPAR
jgi:hypothetical protein